MKLDLSAEHAALRQAVRDFAQSAVKPRAAEVDRLHRFPAEAIDAARELDLMGMVVPEEYGGAGLDHLAFTIAIEEIAAACASTAVIVDVHNSVAVEPIVLFGTDDQKRRWLPPMASGEILGGFALTEPSSGSDAAALKTTARRFGDEWVLNGTKVFITNVGHAGQYTVFARTDPEEPRARGVSCFVVPADTPGVKVGQVFKKMGLNGSPTGELVFEDARVPAGSLLGGEGRGFEIAMRALDSGRIGISGQAVGIGRAAVEEAVAYTKEREQFGQAIAGFQGIAFMLADMATRVEAARLLAYDAAVRLDRGLPVTKQASMAKLFCTDTAMEVAIDAVQLAGGYGYVSEYPFERHFRDAKALQIYEGANQIQRVVIARELVRS